MGLLYQLVMAQKKKEQSAAKPPATDAKKSQK